MIKDYNVIWNSPSKDCSGAMPIGNGRMSAMVYAVTNGSLYALLGRDDSWNWEGNLLKTGRIRIDFEKSPFESGKPFCQTLHLENGSMTIDTEDVKIRIWGNMDDDIIYIQLKLSKPQKVTVVPEFWHRLDGVQDESINCLNRLFWYHNVGDNSEFDRELADFDIYNGRELMKDPYRFNIFGNMVQADNMDLHGDRLVGTDTEFNICVSSLCTKADTFAWRKDIWKFHSNTLKKHEFDGAFEEHAKWWERFWNDGSIIVTDPTKNGQVKLSGEVEEGTRKDEDAAALVTQSYLIHRFYMATQSRGRGPVKFNGGIYTLQLDINDPKRIANHPASYYLEDGSWMTHEDDRLWGGRYTFQNQRLLYWPLLMSGDFDLMKVFFDYYVNMLPVRKAICKNWFGHDGAYYRENVQPTGSEIDERSERVDDKRPAKIKPGEKWKGTCHEVHFESSIELLSMMIEYVQYTCDKEFETQKLLPMAREIIKFYDLHYPREEDGTLRLEPTQAVETYQVCVNDSPQIAGLIFCLDRLMDMNIGDKEDMEYWSDFRKQIPEVPVGLRNGKMVLTPAQEYGPRGNCENPELYPLFPFTLFGVGYGSEDFAKLSVEERGCKGSPNGGCWGQDEIFFAHAGMAKEAALALERRFRIASKFCRFPLFAKEGPDSCPDLDHFGSGSIALQHMLVQETKDEIIILPAWDSKWDAEFKLSLMGGRKLEGIVKGGKLIHYSITPQTNKRVVVRTGK